MACGTIAHLKYKVTKFSSFGLNILVGQLATNAQTLCTARCGDELQHRLCHTWADLGSCVTRGFELSRKCPRSTTASLPQIYGILCLFRKHCYLVQFMTTGYSYSGVYIRVTANFKPKREKRVITRLCDMYTAGRRWSHHLAKDTTISDDYTPDLSLVEPLHLSLMICSA